MADPLVEAKAAEAIHAKTIAAEAEESAHDARTNALLREAEDRMTDAMTVALRKVFGENTETGRFLDQTKIPFICRDIADVRKDQKEMKDDIKEIKDGMVNPVEFNIIRYIVYGACIVVLLTVLSAILLHALPGTPVQVP